VVNALKVPLDVVMANAGLVGMLGRREPERINGIEKQFVVNHLSHFILVRRLLDQVKAARGRIVIVGSNAHRGAPPEGIMFDNLAANHGYAAMKFYSQSKLANHLFARELARRLEGTGVTVNSLHPGLVQTNIFKRSPKWLHWLIPVVGLFAKSPATGAATQCYVATAPALAGVTGVYFDNCNPSVPTATAENDALAARLWTVSEDLTRPH
jgi:WW domain-containing oxidoreductase